MSNRFFFLLVKFINNVIVAVLDYFHSIDITFSHLSRVASKSVIFFSLTLYKCVFTTTAVCSKTVCCIAIFSMMSTVGWLVGWLVGCIEDLRRFSDHSAISRPGSRRSLQIQVVRPGIKPR